MFDFLAVCTCLLALLGTFFFWIPWLGQKSALFGLHELRDRLYAVAERHPWTRDTLLYRDVEYTFASMIAVVREEPFLEAVRFIPSKKDKLSAQEWRVRRYRYEYECVFVGEKDRVGREIYAIYRATESFALLRVALGHPGMTLYFVVATLAAIVTAPVWLPLRWLRTETKQPMYLAPAPRLSKLDTLRHMRDFWSMRRLA